MNTIIENPPEAEWKELVKRPAINALHLTETVAESQFLTFVVFKNEKGSLFSKPFLDIFSYKSTSLPVW